MMYRITPGQVDILLCPFSPEMDANLSILTSGEEGSIS